MFTSVFGHRALCAWRGRDDHAPSRSRWGFHCFLERLSSYSGIGGGWNRVFAERLCCYAVISSISRLFCWSMILRQRYVFWSFDTGMWSLYLSKKSIAESLKKFWFPKLSMTAAQSHLSANLAKSSCVTHTLSDSLFQFHWFLKASIMFSLSKSLSI